MDYNVIISHLTMNTMQKLLYMVLFGSLFTACGNTHLKICNDKETLGKLIFNDITLSEPAGQSCATCHDNSKGFSDEKHRAVSPGAIASLFSQRNSMSICYAKYIPELHYDDSDSTYVGGLFWDGRSPSLQDQAGIPLLNPVEMGNADKNMVVEKVKRTAYYSELVRIYGKTDDVDSIFAYITDAMVAYESSEELSPFSSKFDAYMEGECKLTEQEMRGMELFKTEGQCANCHVMERDEQAYQILFTDFTYDNLGIPRNPDNPHYKVPTKYFLLASDSIDLGLGAIVKSEDENGKFRVPTLRNVELTAPYGHNGYFKTLEDIVHFYNVRDVGNEYPPAEYPATVNGEELGNLGLTAKEEADIVAFMKTLTDGYKTCKSKMKGDKKQD